MTDPPSPVNDITSLALSSPFPCCIFLDRLILEILCIDSLIC